MGKVSANQTYSLQFATLKGLKTPVLRVLRQEGEKTLCERVFRLLVDADIHFSAIHEWFRTDDLDIWQLPPVQVTRHYTRAAKQRIAEKCLLEFWYNGHMIASQRGDPFPYIKALDNRDRIEISQGNVKRRFQILSVIEIPTPTGPTFRFELTMFL